MIIKINLQNNQINLDFDDEKISNISYSLEQTVNLTNLITQISTLSNKIDLDPIDFNNFKNEFKAASILELKLVEYLYKIFNAYNESYDEVNI